MRKRRNLWILVLAIAVLAAGGYWYYTTRYTPAQAETEEATVQTATVRVGELVISASGVGSVIAAEEMSVGFSSSGLIDEIYVGVGDEVQEGGVLAQQGNLDQLELAVAKDELALTEAKAALQDLYDNAVLDLASAQVAIYDAQVVLDDASEAREALDYMRCSQDTIDDYYDSYLDALEQIDNMIDRGVTGDRLDNAESNRDTALANYNYCVAPRTEAELGEADAEVALAEVKLAEAQATVEKLADGPDPDEIAAAEANIAIAEANLEISKKDLDSATLVSPMRGTIMAVTAQVGETTGASFITIADLAVPMLEIFLDEIDLAMAGVGYEVEVIFDALPDDTFVGYITQVDPSLTKSGNTTVIRALVQLDPASFNKPQTLPVGLSASVEVIGSRAENAVLVPVEALRELDPGEYAVFVMEEDEPKLRVVEIGIMDYSYAEVLSGLKAGDKVTTGIVETE